MRRLICGIYKEENINEFDILGRRL